MGAGEHDLVRAPAVTFDETGRDLALDLRLIDRFAAHDALGDDGESRRADQRHLATHGVIAHERVGVIARHGAARRQHADQPRPRRRRRRLDRRHRADERQPRIGRPQRRQSQSGGGAAGDDDDIGLGFADETPPSPSRPGRRVRLRRVCHRERRRRQRRRRFRRPASGAGFRPAPKARPGLNRTPAPAERARAAASASSSALGFRGASPLAPARFMREGITPIRRAQQSDQSGH